MDRHVALTSRGDDLEFDALTAADPRDFTPEAPAR
jgi:hypothetical protein